MVGYLVVCDRSLSFPELASGLFSLFTPDQPVEFTLLMPVESRADASAGESWQVACEAAANAAEVLGSLGLPVAEALACDPFPLKAIWGELKRGARAYDEIAVCFRKEDGRRLPANLIRQLEDKFQRPVRQIGGSCRSPVEPRLQFFPEQSK